MVDRTYSSIDRNVEETEEMRVYRIFQAITKLHLVYIHFTASVKGNLFILYESKDNNH